MCVFSVFLCYYSALSILSVCIFWFFGSLFNFDVKQSGTKGEHSERGE